MNGRTNAHAILSLLGEHSKLGYTQTEIRERTEVPHGSVGPTLHRLEERGLVRHEGCYWEIVKDDRLASVEATGHGWTAIGSRYGEDWYGRNPDRVAAAEHAWPGDDDGDE